MFQDKQAAVYSVMPDMPLIEYPNELNGVLLGVVAAAKIVGSRLGVEVFTPTHFYVCAAIFVYLIFFLSSCIFGMLF